ncbi:MAG: DUF808 domain-containing protein [Zoogloeaceae bacterium]|nr:DUF808 domain-containing protein [Zoogloeaceae bacterium]
MAGASLFALLDDIASILDDVAAMTKLAAKKTAGVLGDDLALNAQQVSGVVADRELPVVWAVAKGSLLNKAILVPAALLISAFLPQAITPLLMAGGLFLCFEGVEKLAHRFLHGKKTSPAAEPEPTPSAAALPSESEKIRGAIRTDFVLSAEIIVISLGIIAEHPMATQVLALVGVALLMTAAVYGIVAAIVKLDDLGLWLSRQAGRAAQSFGNLLLATAPRLMKLLNVVGTLAMFLVGGGILAHGIAALHPLSAQAQATCGALCASAIDLLLGFVAGALALSIVLLCRKLRAKPESAH